MTAYHGGKQLIGRDIATVIVELAHIRAGNPVKSYIEPFCGMLGVYRHIPARLGAAIDYEAGDLNGSVIEMWRALQAGWIPPREYSKDRYEELRREKHKTPDCAVKGYIGHQYSYGGLYFGSYRGDYIPKFCSDKSWKRVQDIARELHVVKFKHGRYEQFSGARDSIIYCDPPYNARTCKYLEPFDFGKFLEWCREMARYNSVFVSNMEDIPGARLVYSRHCRGDTEKLFHFERA